MKKLLTATLVVGMLGGFTLPAQATPSQDLAEFRDYFKKRFPKTPFNDFINGVYSIDAASREQWEEIEEFPPYELNISKGEQLFNTPFANGKGYADCFPNGGIGIAERYPFFDDASGKVITLESAINACRQSNGEEPLGWQKGAIADISAYMHYTSRGNVINIQGPEDNPAAVAAYRDQIRILAEVLLPQELQRTEVLSHLAQLFSQHPDAHIFDSLPGAADLLAPGRSCRPRGTE